MKPLTRRQFLKATAGLTAGILVGDSVIEARGLVVSRYDLPSPTLPPALDGLRIAHLSDLHLPCVAAERAAEVIAAEAPEVVVITGDTVHKRRRLSLIAPYIARARGRLGTFAVRGNNEHWQRLGPPSLAPAYAAAGAQLLENEHAVVRVGDAALQVIGLDDPATGRPDPARAWRDADHELPTIWIMHAPGYIDRLDPAALGVPPALLVLAGHTHGGQIRLPGWTPYVPGGSGRFRSGWYDAPLGRVYISRGVGTSVISARFLCPPELPIFTLRRRT